MAPGCLAILDGDHDDEPVELGKVLYVRTNPNDVDVVYPLVNIKKTMENHHFQWVNQLNYFYGHVQ